MLNKKLLEIIIFVLLGLIIIYISKYLCGNIEKFSNLSQQELINKSEKITDEMYKQLLVINNLSKSDSNTQKNIYLPHFDVLNSYKNTTNNFLTKLSNTISTDLEKKDEYLSRLDNTLFRLSNYKNDEYLKNLKNTDFKTLKSHNNGLNLSLNRLGFNIYQIKVNNGCLSVTPENNYIIDKSNPNDKRQHFKFIHIFNETEYRNSLSNAFPQLSNLGSVHYPFTLVKSVITDNCLKNHHNKLSIEPCREYEGQRWASSKTHTTCNKLF